MPRNDPRKPRPPLDPRTLRDMALHYAARFATTRVKLVTYLERKLRERGWAGEGRPDLSALAEEFAERGYVDDAAFARTRAESMGRRGYGGRRIAVALQQAGIEEGLRADTLEIARDGAFDAAVTLARRRRFGPFGPDDADPAARQKQVAAMIRAGHGFELARRIVHARSEDNLREFR